MDMELKICHMYPDVLNLYGDNGNIICLRRRLEWRHIGCQVTRLPIGEKARLADYDLVFIGGGQDFEQEVLLDDLHRARTRRLDPP
jgi:CobQ-like glutamine amidotransferase family enzyme